MAKATKTIRQALSYQPHHAVWFAANQALFNRIAAFYFEVTQAHEKVLDLPKKEALTALEILTHATEKHPNPVNGPTRERGGLPPSLKRFSLSSRSARAPRRGVEGRSVGFVMIPAGASSACRSIVQH